MKNNARHGLWAGGVAVSALLALHALAQPAPMPAPVTAPAQARAPVDAALPRTAAGADAASPQTASPADAALPQAGVPGRSGAASPSAGAAGTAAAPRVTVPGATAAAPTTRLPPVTVVAASPLLGSGIDRNKAPNSVNVLNDQDIQRTGIPSALHALDSQTPGVSLNDPQGNPFQPDLQYRGFTASPLDGNPQGLAVYVNGVRFNAPFSDAVNWDLLPSLAMDQMNLEGSNPVFGLNALGGALSIQMKNGFTWQGGLAELYGGSFGTVDGSVEYGRQSGDWSTYVAGNIFHSGGWRQLNSSEVHQAYGDIGWRSDTAELHWNIMLADNQLNGPGTVPVQFLAADRTVTFTAPNRTTNRYALTSLSGTWNVSDRTTLQGLIYYTNLSQRIDNGNAFEAAPCVPGGSALCDEDGNPLLDRAGNPIPDYLNGGPYSQLNLQATDSNGYGASLQVSHDSTVLNRRNHLVAGVSFDGGVSTFTASSLLGGITDVNGVFIGPGITIDQPGGPLTPVRVNSTNAYYGAYLADVFDITPNLFLSVAGRLNVAQIDLRDQNGTALTGNHSYTHFNPGIGLTWKALPHLSVYASFSEANRAPTPAELSCASPQSPCTLANFFTGDPDLNQVVAHTVEAGVRGELHPAAGATLNWKVGLFRTDSAQDIIFVASSVPGLAYFQNAGDTRRQGIEAGVTWRGKRLHAWANYAFTDATFQSPLTLNSPLNPAANAAGQIHVAPGNHLPGVPAQRFKFGASYAVTKAWTVGFSGLVSSGQYLFGDEANLTPKTNPYVVVTFNSSYQVTPAVQVFGLVQNLFNVRYETYGTFSPTDLVPYAKAPGATNTRSLAPAAPIAAYGGLRVRF